jgi:hypothetical protein
LRGSEGWAEEETGSVKKINSPLGFVKKVNTY